MPPTPPYLGEFEYAVLLAVAQLGDEAYAVPMRAFIEDRTRAGSGAWRALYRARTARSARVAWPPAWATPRRSVADGPGGTSLSPRSACAQSAARTRR